MWNFNPRPSHEGRPATTFHIGNPHFYFNPRPSHEGRPMLEGRSSVGRLDFNPRPSHEGRPRHSALSTHSWNFNPRPSHEGRLLSGSFPSVSERFQSTSLTRGTTLLLLSTSFSWAISIHVPHTRDDASAGALICEASDFNPRPSHEGRQQSQLIFVVLTWISIHVPHTRDDYLK